MTTNHRPRQTTLRQLATELGVHHSSLSAAIHSGRLTRGIAADKYGRATVIDADEAAADWRTVHVPRVVASSRLREPAPATIWDRRCNTYWTTTELISEHHILGALVAALTSIALDGTDPATLKERIAKRLRVVADVYAADATELAYAEVALAEMIESLKEWADDVRNEDKKTDEKPEQEK